MTLAKLDWLFGPTVPQSQSSRDVSKTQTIPILDEECEVTAHQSERHVWKAYGYAKGKPIHAVGDTAAAAFRRWRHAARNCAHE